MKLYSEKRNRCHNKNCFLGITKKNTVYLCNDLHDLHNEIFTEIKNLQEDPIQLYLKLNYMYEKRCWENEYMSKNNLLSAPTF